MKPTLKVLAIMFACAFLVRFQTNLTPPPYSQYIVSGVVTRTNGLSPGNLVITMVGKPLYTGVDSLVSIQSFRVRGEIDQYPAVTDTAGRFFLAASTYRKADSVALEITGLDKPIIRGITLAVPASGTPITRENAGTQPGCSGCSKQPVTPSTEIVGYRYTLGDQFITVPF